MNGSDLSTSKKNDNQLQVKGFNGLVKKTYLWVSCSDTARRSMEYTYKMEISRIQDNQSILQNREGGNHNESYAYINDSNEEYKDQSYEWLQSVIEKFTRNDLTS